MAEQSQAQILSDSKLDKQIVLAWFESALRSPLERVSINRYYAPYNHALLALISEGIISVAKIGKIKVGWLYKGRLFGGRAGSGDCEEFLICLGEV